MAIGDMFTIHYATANILKPTGCMLPTSEMPQIVLMHSVGARRQKKVVIQVWFLYCWQTSCRQ